MRTWFLSLTIVGIATIGFGGDGTLPFGMQGDIDGVATNYSFDQLERLPPSGSAFFQEDEICFQGYDFRERVGFVVIDSLRYRISGVCHDGLHKEILAQRGMSKIKLRGELRGVAPRRSFKGTVSGHVVYRRFNLAE